MDVDITLMDIPSQSFSSELKWHCTMDTEFLTLLNTTFPLPNQASWTAFHLSSTIVMREISTLQMMDFTGDKWRKLCIKGRLLGDVGPPISSLCEWTLSFKKHHTPLEYEPFQNFPHASVLECTDKENMLVLEL